MLTLAQMGVVSSIAEPLNKFILKPNLYSVEITLSAQAYKKIVIAKQGSAVNSDPVNGSTYSADSVFGDGDELGTGNFVVFNGTSDSVIVTGLDPNTTYHFKALRYTGDPGAEVYTPDTILNRTGSVITTLNNAVGNTNLIWWNAEVGLTVNGSNQITAVDDQGGTNKDLAGVASFLPTLFTDSNGKKWIRFNESSMSANLLNFSTGATDYLFTIVMRYNGLAPAAEIGNVFQNPSGDRFVIQAPPSTLLPLRHSSALPVLTGSCGPVPTKVHIIQYDFTTSSKTYVNGVQIASGAYTRQSYQPTNVRVGSSSVSGTDNFLGDIAQLILIKGTHSELLKSEIRQYFDEIYNDTLYDRAAFLPNSKTISFEDETIFQVGSGINDYLAFPCLTIDSNNDLHLIYTKGPDHNVSTTQHIIYRTSTDGGYTWSSEVTVVPSSGILLTTGGICVVSTGRIIIGYHKVNSPVAQKYMIYSDDDGSTWSSEILVTNDYPDPGQISGPSNPFEYEGDLYWAMYGRTTGSGDRECVLYKSTDGLDGEAWSKISVIQPAISQDYEEPEVIPNADGLFIALLRSDSQAFTRMVFSWDKGITWSTVRQDVVNSIGFNGAAVSPLNGIFSFGRRATDNRTIIQYSANGGQNWTTRVADARTGANMYGKAVWHPVLDKFIGVYAAETTAPINYTGPTHLVCTRWDEI